MTGIIIQARLGSKRLPSKVHLPFCGDKSILDILIEKLKSLHLPIILATSTNEADNKLKEYSIKHEIQFFQGDEDNVLLRFVECAKQFKIDKVVRICSDNPFIDINLIEKLIYEMKKKPELDYVTHSLEGTPSMKCHLGIFSELVKFQAIEDECKKNKNIREVEHVTLPIYLNPSKYRVKFIPYISEINIKNFRLTIDTKEDFENAKKIYNEQQKINNFSTHQVFTILRNNNLIQKSMIKQIKNHSK